MKSGIPTNNPAPDSQPNGSNRDIVENPSITEERIRRRKREALTPVEGGSKGEIDRCRTLSDRARAAATYELAVSGELPSLLDWIDDDEPTETAIAALPIQRAALEREWRDTEPAPPPKFDSSPEINV